MFKHFLMPVSLALTLGISDPLPAMAEHDLAKPHHRDGHGQRVSGNGRAGTLRSSVNCGDVLSESGNYKLDQHLVCDGEIGIEITASNVHLDLGGYGIFCDRELGSNPDVETIGIFVHDASQVHIANGAVSDCYFGIFLLNTEKSQVHRMTLTNNNVNPEGDPSGLLVTSSSGNKISKNEMTSNGHGISLFDSHDNRLLHNKSSDNLYDGLRLLPIGPGGGSNENRVIGNDLSRNGDNGVQMFGPAVGNTLLQNTANDNGFIGFIVYGIPEDFPVPVGNQIKSNTVLGNEVVDLAELDLTTDDSLPLECFNDWKGNTFGSEFGPPMCIK